MQLLKNGIKESQKNDIASLVRRFGAPVSTILLHSTDCIFFSIPQVKGIIGYQLVRNCAVVVGDPVCLPQDVAPLTQAFHHHCKTNQWKIVYLVTSDSFSHWAINNGCQTLIQVGEELFVDPVNFSINQKLRWKINQSNRQGIVIKENTNHSPIFENQAKNVIESWLAEKKGPQVHLGNFNFDSSLEKRIFYAEQNDKIIGLLTLSPVERFHGWVVGLFLSLESAPQGTAENLLISAFDTLANENCQFCCLGAVAGAKVGEIVGLNYLSKLSIRLLFELASWYFNLKSKSIYLYKYHPHKSPTFIVLSDKLTFIELMAIKKTLNVEL